MAKPKPKLIEGNGSSIWGESNGKYEVLGFEVEDVYNENDYANVVFFGNNLRWYQYTDRQIPKELLSKFRAELETEFGRRVKELYWTEQGMQPEEGWSIGVDFYKK